MPITPGTDFELELNEKTFNFAFRNLMQQRPSLFNYATKSIIKDPTLWCCWQNVEDALWLHQHLQQPIFSRLNPIHIPGSNRGLQWIFQICDIKVDLPPPSLPFLPGSCIPVPPRDLTLRIKACFAIQCPPEFDSHPPLPNEPIPGSDPCDEESGKGCDDIVITPLPKTHLDAVHLCFTAKLQMIHDASTPGFQFLSYIVLAVELDTDAQCDGTAPIQPPELHNMIRCLVRATIQFTILPRIRLEIGNLSLGVLSSKSIILQPVKGSPLLDNDEVLVSFKH